MIEQQLQSEIMKLDRLQQLGHGMDIVRGIDVVLDSNNGLPFHATVFERETGVIVYKTIDQQLSNAIKGGLGGVYRELVAENSKGAADRIVEKHR